MALKVRQQDSDLWWLADKFDKQPHDTLYPWIEHLTSYQTGRFENYRRLIATYERGSKYRWREDMDDAVLTDKALRYNHARNGVDTVHCKWVKSTELPMALTIGGTALERSRAKDLEKALHGELRKNSWEELDEQAGLDALVCGIGWVHVLHNQPTLTVDWAPAEDVLFDPAETRQKKRPRFIARRFIMDRYVALDTWGKKDPGYYGSVSNRVNKIRNCRVAYVDSRVRDTGKNMIAVWACWHQRSTEEAEDGAYAVVIDGATLEFTDWDRDYIPLFPLVPYPRMRMLNGLSLMADFLPVQEEHDKLSYRIQKAHHRIGGTHVIALRGANVDVRDLNNEQGTVIEADADVGPDPVREFNPTPVNPQTYQYRDGLISEMYASKGIPTMTATGQTEPGMEGASGKARESAEDAQADRMIIPFRARKRFMLAVSKGIIEEARAMVEDDPKYSVLHKDEKRALGRIKWKDVLIDQGSFDLDLFPINSLSKDPSAKFAQLTELLKAGGIQAEQFRRLFELPDLEAENEVDLADIEIIDQVMDQIIIEGVALQPESFDYLDLIVQRGRKFYNLCRKKHVPEERLALLRDYLKRAKFMNDAAKMPPPQAQAMPGGPVTTPTPPGAPPPGQPAAPPPAA